MELEAVIDPDKLGQFHTFYCVAVPQPQPYWGSSFSTYCAVTFSSRASLCEKISDGQPQPYKVNDTAAEYEYCHSFSAGEDQSFSFLFEPVTGSAGDTLALTVVSITNPDFQPDMESTSSYGWYHRRPPPSEKSGEAAA